MKRIRQFGLRLAAVALLIGAAGAVSPLFPIDFNYSEVRPDPAKMTEMLEAAPVSLAEAIGIAEQAVDGHATYADAIPRGERFLFNIVAYNNDAAFMVMIDGATGTVVRRQPVPRYPGAMVEGEPVTTESGLAYFDLEEGEGEVPPSPEATVKVHYTGWTVDGRTVDSSLRRNQPAEFKLNGVIAGWTEGVGSMKVGGKRKLIIPFDLAYGAQGSPPAVPPRATLIFDVELLEIVDPGTPATDDPAGEAVEPESGGGEPESGDGDGG
ncbi:MAG: FKBP-type peptidyl-prolyl cis-trans isomerase [Phycisphaerales bacterium]